MATTANKIKASRAPKATKVTRDVAQETTDKIVALLEAGTVAWQKTWTSTNTDYPTSLSTGKPYRGVNVFTLWITGMVKGYQSNRWGTYKQIAERGGQVRKGEKSTEIVFWRILKKTERVEGKDVEKKIPLLRFFHVFNVDQADWPEGSKLPVTVEREHKDIIAEAEALVAEYIAEGPSVSYHGDRACYAPRLDAVTVPVIDDFVSAEAFYATLYHELTHSTGHETRLKREGIAQGTFGAFGDKVYSNEELIAEMGAAMLCGIAGIEQAATLDNSAAYLAHWIQALKGDKHLVIRAASSAQKAVDLIIGTTFDDDKEEEES